MKRCVVIFLITCLFWNAIRCNGGGCVKISNNIDLVEYSCDSGGLEDLQLVPDDVEKLRVTNFPLEHITEKHFSRFGRSLLVLTCSHCSISEINNDAFRSLENLQQLSLDNNKLKEVKAAWFERLSSLTYLDLNYNQIEKIEPEVFRLSPDLVDLRISGNKLHCLDLEALSKLRELKRIFVSDNEGFGCPNALRRYLDARNIEYEKDSAWDAQTIDRVPTSEPSGISKSSYPISRHYPTTRTQQWTETTYPITTAVNLDTRYPSRQPELIQPAAPNAGFSIQGGPFFEPKVTQQQLDHYRMPHQTTTTIGTWNGTSQQQFNATKRVPLAMDQLRLTTTTECPKSSAKMLKRISTMMLLVVAFLL